VQQQAEQSGQPVFRRAQYDFTIRPLENPGSDGRKKSDWASRKAICSTNVQPISFLSSSNNVFTRQYQSFAGVSITQTAAEKTQVKTWRWANIRLAAMESDHRVSAISPAIDACDFSQAEAAYWNLYFRPGAIDVFSSNRSCWRRRCFSDSRERLKSGGALRKLDVLESGKSGLGLAPQQTE